MIEIGEYVRTKKGIIDKIKTINRYGIITKYDDKDDKISSSINYYFNDGLEIDEENIVKHSKNIIDLLEVGDLINKSEVYVLGQTDNGQKWIKVCNGYLYFENDLLRQTILTKEQYMQNCYKCQDIENGTI